MARRNRVRIVAWIMQTTTARRMRRPMGLQVVLGLICLLWLGIALGAQPCPTAPAACLPMAGIAAQDHTQACATLAAMPSQQAAVPAADLGNIAPPPPIVAQAMAPFASVIVPPARGQPVRGLPSPLAATGRLRL
jgi:hypothetical protein